MSPTWLYDVAVYALYSAFGGTAVVFAKALLSGCVAILILDMSTRRGGWRIPLVVTGLAVLAMGSRLLLQPASVSVLLVALLLWHLIRSEERATDGWSGWWPGWRLVLLFALWGNIDERCLYGLVLVVLIWFGRLLDSRTTDKFWRALALHLAGIVVLAAAACVNPSHVKSLDVPPELRSGASAPRTTESGSTVVSSPFSRIYLSTNRGSPAALSYFPLVALGLLSFLLNRRGWRWAWALPWFVLGIVSAIEVSTVPFFAVVAGPVTAWNLVAFFARRETPAPLRPWTRTASRVFTSLLALAFLVCTWPGWLQGPPFEPRQWVLEAPASVQHAADFLHRAHTSALWPEDTRTLHLSPNTASAFTWFCPEDRGVRDAGVVAQLIQPTGVEKARQQLQSLGVTRIVVSVAEPGYSSRELLERLLALPEEWPVLHLRGGVVIFGWRQPTRVRGPNLYEGWEVSFDQLAFSPEADEVAPPASTTSERPWWHAFWKPAPPPHPAARDEAFVLLRKSEAMIPSAQERHERVWYAGQQSALVATASAWAWFSGPAEATLRLALVAPEIPPQAPTNAIPPVTPLAFALQQQFAADRGYTPVGILYSAIRASRRAIAENPNDAMSYYNLSEGYAALVRTTSEQRWAMRIPQLMRLRELQASAALNKAVELNPYMGEAHLELARLYLTTRCLDLAATHLRAYRDLPPQQGGPKKGDRRAEGVLAELDRVTKEVNAQTEAWTKETALYSVRDRAAQAVDRGLAGLARDLLLKSDVAAFGTQGMELELNLLLRTGRPEDVLEWMTPELRGSLGDFTYYWFRAQAHIALGNYAAADTELSAITGPAGEPVEQIGAAYAMIACKTLLDQQPGWVYGPQIMVPILSQFDFRSRVSLIEQRLGRVNDVLVLRGLVALEAGTIDRARESFRAALVYSPNRWGDGQLEFNGRWVAWACLDLIDSAAATRKRNR
jgi:tetratricopeptide (TPR) repeat protein